MILNKNIFLWYFLVFLSPMQVPLIGGVEIAGISINALKDLGCLSILIFALLNQRYIVLGRKVRIIFLLQVTILIFALIVSPKFLNGFQYFMKLLFPLLAFVYFSSIDYYWAKWDKITLNLIKFLTIFLIVSIAFGILLGDPAAGITSRHYLKFNAVFLFLLGFSSLIILPNKLWPTLAIGISLLANFYIVQRGAMVSIFLGAAVILYMLGYFSFKRAIISCFILAVSVYGLFQNDKFVEYSFYEGKGPEYIISELQEGRFDPSFIRDRERGALIEAMLDGYPTSYLPSGLGTAKERVNRRFSYFGGKEPHNDWVVLSIDLGLFGAIIYLILFICLVKIGLNSYLMINENTSNGMKILLVSSIGMSIGMHVWMSFSNVIIYSTSSLVLPFLLIGTANRILTKKAKVLNTTP